MLGIVRFLTTVFVALCSFVIIILNRHLPFPLEIWGLDKSPAAKWILFGLCVLMLPSFLAFIWLVFFDWFFERIMIRSMYDLLQDELRSLKFFLNLTIIMAGAFFLFIVFMDDLPPLSQRFVILVSLFLSIEGNVAYHFFLKSRKALKEIRKDFMFINSPGALSIIGSSYKCANFLLKRALRDIFPRQT